VSDFINRNRVFWMNTRGVTEIKVLINDDLFNLPENISSRDEISINIKHSDRPFAVGIMTYMSNSSREYVAYGNDVSGNIQWVEEFESFSVAVSFAKKAYIRDIDEMYYDYMYEDNTKILKK